MTNEFEVGALIDELLEREGGYVNHPADKGGPTCFGITWRRVASRAERRFCSARSRRSRVSATCGSPSAAPPTKRFCTAGSRYRIGSIRS